MIVIVRLEVTREDGMNCSGDDVIEALQEQIDFETEISLESPNGSESTYSVALLDASKEK